MEGIERGKTVGRERESNAQSTVIIRVRVKGRAEEKIENGNGEGNSEIIK